MEEKASRTELPREVFVQLLGEGTYVARPTTAVHLGNNLYRLLPAEDYQRNGEEWEFPPGASVKLVRRKSQDGKEYWLAVKPDIPTEDDGG